MSGSSVRMVAVSVVVLLVGGLVGCGDRSSSTLVTSLPTTTAAEEQASFDGAYQIVVAMVPVLPSDVGIGSSWLIYWCDVNPWWYRQEFPEVVNGYLVVLPAYKVEGGFRESISGANVGPDC